MMPFCMELTDTVALDILATDTVDTLMEDMHLVATPTPTLLTTDSEECPRTKNPTSQMNEFNLC